jgi:hypothetical protein
VRGPKHSKIEVVVPKEEEEEKKKKYVSFYDNSVPVS